MLIRIRRAREPVFVDTSGWLPILNTDDRLHPEAADHWRRLIAEGHVILTTDWVLSETGNGLARTRQRLRFPGFARSFSNSPRSQLIRVDDDLFRRALELDEQASDKTWGLVDCARFVAMRAESSREVLGSDRHFAQAGFACLLPGAG